MARRDIPGAQTGNGAAATLSERLHGFRSLGDNCEFGFVQRYGGVAPSGLLRFAYTPLEDLIRGLRCGFADFGVPGRLRRHVGRHREPALGAYTRAVDPAGFGGDTVHVFSTWVWIPEDFSGTRIFAVAGYDRRGCWQRVWAAGRLRPDADREPVGLGMIGTHRDRFWSIGARFAEGPIPGAEPPPALAMPPARLPGLDRLGRRIPRLAIKHIPPPWCRPTGMSLRSRK